MHKSYNIAITIRKVCYNLKNVSQIKIFVTVKKRLLQLETLFTNRKNLLHLKMFKLEKFVTVKKCVTLRKCVTVKKMCQN